MGHLANLLAPRQLHEQRGGFHRHSANFYTRWVRPNDWGWISPTSHCLRDWAYAQNVRNYHGASELFNRLAQARKPAGDEEGEALAYHQLGMIAEEQRDLQTAEAWYRKSLAIEEKQGNEHGAAITCAQLGILAGLQEHYEQAGQLLVKAILALLASNDRHVAQMTVNNFLIFHQRASVDVRSKLKVMWEEAGLAPSQIRNESIDFQGLISEPITAYGRPHQLF